MVIILRVYVQVHFKRIRCETHDDIRSRAYSLMR